MVGLHSAGKVYDRFVLLHFVSLCSCTVVVWTLSHNYCSVYQLLTFHVPFNIANLWLFIFAVVVIVFAIGLGFFCFYHKYRFNER